MKIFSFPIFAFLVLIGSIQTIETRDLFDRAPIKIHKAINNQILLDQLNKDAEIAEKLFSWDKAIEIRKKILNISENIYQYNNQVTATASYNLGLLYRTLGQYEKAEPYLKKAIDIDIKLYGSGHTKTATARNILGLLYSDLGQFSKAELLLKQALETYKKEYGLQHTKTASILNNLGFLYKDLRLYKNAEPLLKQALKIYQNNAGLEDQNISTVLKNLGLLYGEIGQFKKAEILLKKSLDIRQKIFEPHNPRLATALNNLGFLYTNLGQYEKAEPLLKESLEIYKKAYGLQHPRSLMALNHLGLLYKNLGQHEKANSFLKRGVIVNSLLIQREAPYLAIANRRAYVDSLRNSQERVYSNISENLSNKRLAFFRRINRQGLLEEIEKRQSQLASLPGLQQEVAAQLRNINQKIANIGVDPEQRQILNAEREKIEKKLYRILPEFKPRIVEIEDIARALPKGSLLIEFQRYKPVNINQDLLSKELPPARYVAMVLDPSKKELDDSGRITKYKISLVDLGLAEPLEQKIKEALIASEQGLKDAEFKWKKIGELIIQPLASATEGSRTWFISPDGELNSIPFAALSGPNGDDDLLGEQLQLRLLTTGRELLDLKMKNKSVSNVSLVVANPLFDQQKNTLSDSIQKVTSFDLKSYQRRSLDMDLL